VDNRGPAGGGRGLSGDPPGGTEKHPHRGDVEKVILKFVYTLVMCNLDLTKYLKNSIIYCMNKISNYSNFRNIKIGKIKARILYRSCHPSWGDVCDSYVQAYAEKAGIKTIVNLEDSEDDLIIKLKDGSWYYNKYIAGCILAAKINIDFMENENMEKLNKILKFLMDREGPYLIHCASGKDRTGILCALIEAFMGGTIEEIIEDYMLSYINYYDFNKNEQRYKTTSEIIEKVFQLLDVNNKKYIENIAEEYFMTKIKLSKEEILILKNKLSKQ
jgi:protein tyrosine/serine phosphatase